MKKYFVILVLSLMTLGCEDQIDVPFVVDEDEIARYIADADLGRAFFPKENYFLDSTQFVYPQDSNAIYILHIDSVKRSVLSSFPLENNKGQFIDEPYQFFGPPFGTTSDAEVEVRDKVYIKSLRIEGSDTTEYFTSQDISRYGYFMKLGDDGERFKGWILRAFSGGTPRTANPSTRINLYHGDSSNDSLFDANTQSYINCESLIIGTVVKFDPILQEDITTLDTVHFTTNQSYVELVPGTQYVERVSPGELISAKVLQSSNYMFFTMGVDSDTGFMQNTFDFNAQTELEATINIPNDPAGTWGFIYFQEYYRNTGDTFAVPQINFLLNRKWVVPYYIE